MTSLFTSAASDPRTLLQRTLLCDLVIVGGGLSGVCCAITAAREGLRVILVQDRPVLGGNASSEVRLWILGATSHMGNNNRWAREGGVIDELLVENLWRNPEGNPILFDSLLLEMVSREQKITLLLNTAVYEVQMNGTSIECAVAFCSQNQTTYRLCAPLFCDASGDGILGFLSGAAFRMGAEAKDELDELLAPEKSRHDLLGHSLYFYYVSPSFALSDIAEIPRFRELRVSDTGCRLWWLEYGGARDTIYETEEIKWELWRVAYGVWNYIKNSGEFPDAETLTLEWMGMIPGKRESRRFEGDFMLSQRDVVEQREHEDAVSYGGWAIDLHPADGVFSPDPACTQWHSKGIYQIPYRTMYSRNVPNLFLGGRLISATHIAFGSTRVMATCAHNGQAVGMAAVLCRQENVLPRDLLSRQRMQTLQQALLRSGQFIPGVRADDPADLAQQASVSASSTLELDTLQPNGDFSALDRPIAMLLPLPAGKCPTFTLLLKSDVDTTVHAELWGSRYRGNTTPEYLLADCQATVPHGDNHIRLTFSVQIVKPAHYFLMLSPQKGVEVGHSNNQITGVLAVSQTLNKSVAKDVVQSPPEGAGVDTFAFWLPQRRPAAATWAMQIDPPLKAFEASNVINGISRPWAGVNAWLPDMEDSHPWLKLHWEGPQKIRRIEVAFDTDFDHPMESVLIEHPERVMPACITSFDVCASGGKLLAHIAENHQTRWQLTLSDPILTDELEIRIHSYGNAIPAIFEVRCY
jgi:hypothetical protein